MLIAIGVLNFGIGFFVWWKDRRNPVHRAFALFSTGASLWIAGFGALLFTHNEAFIPLLNLGGLTLVAGLFRFSLVFPNPHSSINVPWGLYIPFLFGYIAALYPGFIIEHVVFVAGHATPTQGPWFPLYALGLSIYTGASLYLLSRSYRRATRIERMRLQYFVLGIATFIVLALLCDVLLPAVGIFSLNIVGPAASVVSIIATAYAILKHELLDIRIVLQRGIMYTTLASVIIAAYATLVTLFGIVYGTTTGSILMSAGITTILGILGAPFIERYLRRVTNAFFFKDSYDYAESLHALSEALHRNLEFADMDREARAILDAIFHPTSINIKETGEVVLGDKRSGDPYTRTDIRLIETFSHQAAIAFERARLFTLTKAHAQELEAKVQERTEQLRSAQAHQEQMLTEIAHHLQTPLSIVQLKLEELKRLAPSDTQVGVVESSLARLSTFMYSLLRLAKLEHTDTLSLKPISLTELLKDIVEEMTIIAESRSITVRADIQESLWVRGDAEHLREAMLNVLSNSVKYMSNDRRREITCSATQIGHWIAITISDTGIGIAPHDLPRVFSRFYRVPGTEHVARGSGLGLAITERIVTGHGGTISMTSEVGVGTATTIRLPAL